MKEGEKQALEAEANGEVQYPLNVVYCPISGVPPEYSQYVMKDLTECKAWLKENHPLMFTELYGEVEDGQIQEESKGAPKKEKKVVKFGKEQM